MVYESVGRSLSISEIRLWRIQTCSELVDGSCLAHHEFFKAYKFQFVSLIYVLVLVL